VNYLTVVNTYRHRPSFPKTYASLLANRSGGGPVKVVADSSPQLTIPCFHVVCNSPGLARLAAWQFALDDDDAEIIAVCDDDLLFHPGFDQVALDLLERYGAWYVSTPYRSAHRRHAELEQVRGDHVFSPATGGCCIFAYRVTIEHLLNSVPQEDWMDQWDWKVWRNLEGCVKPVHSMVEHVGVDGIHGRHLRELLDNRDGCITAVCGTHDQIS